MDIVGIRICDTIEHTLTPTLLDILECLKEGNEYQWLILFLDGILNKNSGWTIQEIEKKMNHSEAGYFISWNDLKDLSKKFFQIYDARIIGSKNSEVLKRYNFDEIEVYNAADIVISLVDTSYFEIVCKNDSLIHSLKKKFKKIELLYNFPI